MTKKVNSILILILLLWGNLNLFGQNNTMSSNIPKTEDKRYITQVDANSLEIQLKDNSGLVKEITLGIEWWTLLNEPVERYLFRWKKGDNVYSELHGIYLSESSLSEYPDLLKRYKNLKPSSIEIDIEVWLNHDNIYNVDNQTIFKNLPSCLRKSSYASVSGKTFYEIKNNYGTRSINSNGHFYITKSGDTGNDLSPGSVDWTQFIKYSCPVDKKSGLALFKSSTSASFAIQVLNIEIPTLEINAIAKEYIKRENKEEPQSVDDFLANQNTSKQTDDFLSNTNINSGDFLSENNENDDFISKEDRTKWKINTKDGKTGIITESGKILIPYGNYSLSEYNNGIAKASVKIDEFGCSSGITTAYKVGYIDKSGEFIDGHKIEFTTAGYSPNPNAPLTIVHNDSRGNRDYESERRAKMEAARKKREKEERKRREKERCDSDTESWKERIINQYRYD
ncbi:hypothetical protein [Mangrovimonas cancribranchiae]|uniref:Uncharacterized protein n=1 Tax=Mangrovimonas cancribranchiae TaxID=3080055 RepID=A0AAU6P7G8_9FLAO